MESGEAWREGGRILRECNEIVEGRSFLEPLCCNLHEFRNFYFTYFRKVSRRDVFLERNELNFRTSRSDVIRMA